MTNCSALPFSLIKILPSNASSYLCLLLRELEMLPAMWELQVSVEFRKLLFRINAACPIILKTPDLQHVASIVKTAIGIHTAKCRCLRFASYSEIFYSERRKAVCWVKSINNLPSKGMHSILKVPFFPKINWNTHNISSSEIRSKILVLPFFKKYELCSKWYVS